MARLSELEASGLVDRLTGESTAVQAGQDETDEAARRTFQDLAASGELGPLLGRRLTAYLNRPVRCTSGDAPDRPALRTSYAATAPPGVWISIDTVLAAAIADVMIGGEGDPARTGAGHRATRLAAHAAADLIAALSSALGTQSSSGVQRDPDRATLGPPIAGGTMIVGSQEYGWFAGLRLSQPVAGRTATSTAVRRPASSPKPHAVTRRGSLEDALEAARSVCEGAVKTRVAFGAPRVQRETPARLPAGHINVGAPAPHGTAVLSVDERAASLLLAALTGIGRDDVLGTFARAGVETLANGILYAFVDAVAGPESVGRHALALTDAAILAAAPHDAIEHDVLIGERTGTFRWLVPSDFVRPEA